MKWYMFENMSLLDEDDMLHNYDYMLETIDYIERELPDNIEYSKAYTIMKEEWNNASKK